MKRSLTMGLLLLCSQTALAGSTTFSFSTTLGSTTAFNDSSRTNDSMVSADGKFTIEFFWLNNDGHEHDAMSCTGSSTRLDMQASHNYAYGYGMEDLQGMRVTRTDNGSFNLDSLDLYGEAAVGTISDYTTGSGSWTLYQDTSSGVPTSPATVSLGSSYQNITEIYIVDPWAAGSSNYYGYSDCSYWDNLVLSLPDPDGDGYDETEDCDESDVSINPGATEYCDGIDNNCDGTVDEDSAADASTFYVDGDGDGFGDNAQSYTTCYQPTSYVTDNTDCDDADATAYPGVAYLEASLCTHDADGDGYGDANAASPIDAGSDCDDTDASTYPGASEYCDGHDDDCDGEIDEDDSLDASTWYADTDADGYGDAASTDLSCYVASGYVADATDCDDADAATYPGADEYCDGHDDDCDGDVDEDDSVDVSTWYADTDGDGEGDAAVSDIACYQPTGYVSGNTDCDDTDVALNTSDGDADGYTSCDSDCNDTDAAINVDAEEIWYDGIDQDCDGWSDFDQDGDGFDHVDWDGDDCDDEDPDINVDAEEIWYDGIDQDCDSLSDFDADYDGQDSESYGGDDCDDADPDTYDGAPDTPYDGIITDCSNANDYDADGDGVLAADYGGKDCDDANSDVYPDAEEIWYDGIDQDCDGNDDDQDEDGYALDADCDDEDPEVFENCDADTGDIGGDTGGSDTGDAGGDSSDKEGGCFSSTTGGRPAGMWALLAAGLIVTRRRARWAVSRRERD